MANPLKRLHYGELGEIESVKSVLSIINKSFGTQFRTSDSTVKVPSWSVDASSGGVTITLDAIDESKTVIHVHIRHQRVGRFSLIGEIDEPYTPLLRRLADTVCLSLQQQIQLQQSRQEVEFLAMQVSQDFEELAWLRQCGTIVQSLGVRSRIGDLAHSILWSLVDIVQARQLAMVTYREPISVDDYTAILTRGEVTSFGTSEYPDEAIHEIYQRYGLNALRQPFVSSSIFDPVSNHNIELILVPIRIESKLFGWLIALESFDESSDAGRYDSDIHESSFGSFEAGLVASAASFLASFEQSRLLFSEHEDLLIGVVRSLVNTIDAKDAYTCGHSDRVAEISRLLGQQLGLDEKTCEQLHLAGLLHDIGKIGVPDAILLKPGNLSDEEFELLKQHPVIGFQVLKNLKQMSFILDGVLHHHESMDGSGYPSGLAGEEIPFAARIIAVADAFDAMTSNRPYRSGMPVEQAEAILLANRGPQWDPQVLDAFFAAQDRIYEACFGRPENKQRFDPIRTSVAAVH